MINYKLVKKFSISFFITLSCFGFLSYVYGDDKKLGKTLKIIEKKIPVLEKQVEIFAKVISNEKHKKKIVSDLKKFNDGKRVEKKLSEMYLYKVYKKLKVPMEDMYICYKDIMWFDDSSNFKPPINLLNPVSLMYLITGTNHSNSSFSEIWDRRLVEYKNLNKLYEILEILKNLQQIQIDAFAENVEDEIELKVWNNQWIMDVGQDLNTLPLSAKRGFKCSKKGLKKFSKSKGTALNIMYLAVHSGNINLDQTSYNNHVIYESNLSQMSEKIISTTPKSYLLNLASLFSWYSEIEFDHYYDEEKSMEIRIKILNNFIENNYDEEEVSIDDLQDKESSDDDEELDLDELKID